MPQLRATIQSEKFRQLSKKAGFLCAAFWIYLIVGALLFSTLEFEAREDEIEDAVEELEGERRNLLEVLWAHTLAKSEHEWMELANRKLDIYERELQKNMDGLEALLDGIDMAEVDEDGEEDDDNPWDFWGALFFSFTSVTTIGYGNICPETWLGKLGTIVYATIGVPLTLIYLNEVGKLLCLILHGLLHKSDDEEELSEEYDFTLAVALASTLAWMLLGAVVFWILDDDWDLVDAAYFCFVTFSTLGFGDFVPDDCIEIIAMMLYSQVALSLCAMSFNAVQLVLEDKLNTRYDTVSDWFTAKLESEGPAGKFLRLVTRTGVKEE